MISSSNARTYHSVKIKGQQKLKIWLLTYTSVFPISGDFVFAHSCSYRKHSKYCRIRAAKSYILKLMFWTGY
uniref:Uncharacterized protein n=1 Tax=Triticum urartu TaxID=4572 RepID=A0A8R7QBY2_TRIUA